MVVGWLRTWGHRANGPLLSEDSLKDMWSAGLSAQAARQTVHADGTVARSLAETTVLSLAIPL